MSLSYTPSHFNFRYQSTNIVKQNMERASNECFLDLNFFMDSSRRYRYLLTVQLDQTFISYWLCTYSIHYV